jgi:hypothetical protein
VRVLQGVLLLSSAQCVFVGWGGGVGGAYLSKCTPASPCYTLSVPVPSAQGLEDCSMGLLAYTCSGVQRALVCGCCVYVHSCFARLAVSPPPPSQLLQQPHDCQQPGCLAHACHACALAPHFAAVGMCEWRVCV